ncbi:MAG TPA: hypothetical protein VEH06_16125 [Candidatus Bathyarchaeia archaeon]|nr:hypothetical protein [Candidatus Bathyarchaeia archaeon]
MAIVIFGRWKPFWILMGAWLFGMVDALQLGLQATGISIPSEFLLMLPYIVPIAFMAGMYKKSAPPAASERNETWGDLRSFAAGHDI